MSVAILGAGPAGMSCANALLTFGLEPLVIEAAAHVGGIQRANFHPNLWMLGIPGETGTQITERLARHYFELPITTLLNSQMTSVRKTETGFRLTLASPQGAAEHAVRAIVIATGARPQATPELETLARLTEHVVIGPLSDRIRDEVRDARVLILGGGDNALDHALFLAELGNRVTVSARGSFSARKQFQDACSSHPRIELRPGQAPTALDTDQRGIRASWADHDSRFDWLLVMYGYRPNNEVLDGFEAGIRPALEPAGQIRVDRRQQTTVAGIYAAGDITDSIQPSVPTALAQGLAAAKAIEQDMPRL
jgi:thioredoxin reductase (NADPH)